SSYVQDVAVGPHGRIWAEGLGGISGYEGESWVERITPGDGLPHARVMALALDPESGLWAGPQPGAARDDGERWSVRHSRRWLADDEVVDIAADASGGAWIATRRGISHIAARKMTLADKAAYFEQVIDERHVREPWLVEKIHLKKPHDL